MSVTVSTDVGYLSLPFPVNGTTVEAITVEGQYQNGGWGGNAIGSDGLLTVDELRRSGSLAALNSLLQHLLFSPPTGWNSHSVGQLASISLYADDGGQIGDRSVCLSEHINSSSVSMFQDQCSLVGEGAGLTATGSVFALVLPSPSRTSRSALPYVLLPGSTYASPATCESPEMESACRERQCGSVLSVDVLVVSADRESPVREVAVGLTDPQLALFGVPSTLRLTVTAEVGTPKIATAELLASFDAQNGAFSSSGLSLSLMGSANQLNGWLTSLTYLAAPDYVGHDSL